MAADIRLVAIGSEAARARQNSYLVTARDRDHFALSDLAAYYFGGYQNDYEGEGESEGGRGLTGYIYTDRPVYRPAPLSGQLLKSRKGRRTKER